MIPSVAVPLKNIGSNPNKEDKMLLAMQQQIDVALEDFISFMQWSYPFHKHVRKALLISEAQAPAQGRLHYDIIICMFKKEKKMHFNV
jgi:hypothetical protein